MKNFEGNFNICKKAESLPISALRASLREAALPTAPRSIPMWLYWGSSEMWQYFYSLATFKDAL